jgi:DNA-binding response OmpR family regulator
MLAVIGGERAGAGGSEIVAETVVLADDDDDLRAVYAPFLRAQGYTVWEAGDGRAAVDQVRRHHPDLLLLDLWMPVLNGFEVLEELRYDPAAARLKVVMFSVQSDADSRLEGLGCGASAFLIKGLGLADLRDQVGRILDESRAQLLSELA